MWFLLLVTATKKDFFIDLFVLFPLFLKQCSKTLKQTQKLYLYSFSEVSFLSRCVWFLAFYSIAGGHPRTDTDLIPDQLLETADFLLANICGSSPQFDGKRRTWAPSCSSLFSLFAHSRLSLWCLFFFFFFWPREHLLPMISGILEFNAQKQAEAKRKQIRLDEFGWVTQTKLWKV